MAATFLDRCIEDSFSRGRHYRQAAELNLKGATATQAMMSIGGMGNRFSQGVNQSAHQEQYRFYTGWVYAAIKAIAQRAAGQPVMMAKKKSKSLGKIKPTARLGGHWSKGRPLSSLQKKHAPA